MTNENTSNQVCYGERFLCCYPHLKIHGLERIVTHKIKTGIATAEIERKRKAAGVSILGAFLLPTDSNDLASGSVGVGICGS